MKRWQYHPILAVQILLLAACLWRPLPSYAQDRLTETDKSAGSLQLYVIRNEKTHLLLDEPDSLKTTLDAWWDEIHRNLREKLQAFISTITNEETADITVTLTPVTETELFLYEEENGISIHYRLPKNSVAATFRNDWLPWWPSYTLSFDIEFVLTLQAGQADHLIAIDSAELRLTNEEIQGNDPLNQLIVFTADLLFFEEKAEAMLQPIETFLQPAAMQMGTWMEDIVNVVAIPQNQYFAIDLSLDASGDVLRICAKPFNATSCHFPTP